MNKSIEFDWEKLFETIHVCIFFQKRGFFSVLYVLSINYLENEYLKTFPNITIPSDITCLVPLRSIVQRGVVEYLSSSHS